MGAGPGGSEASTHCVSERTDPIKIAMQQRENAYASRHRVFISDHLQQSRKILSPRPASEQEVHEEVRPRGTVGAGDPAAARAFGSAMVTVLGDCALVGDCVQTYGHPSADYTNHAACTVTNLPAVAAHFVAFDVEPGARRRGRYTRHSISFIMRRGLIRDRSIVGIRWQQLILAFLV